MLKHKLEFCNFVMMKIFLTGKPGIVKTTIVKEIVKNLKDKVVGFWTEEVRDIKTHQRVGFKIIDTEGNECVFANKNFESPFVVGSYKVDLKKFESIAIPILQKTLQLKDKVIIIDEIGKMELFSENFVELISKIVFQPEYKLVATLPIKNVHPVVEKIRNLNNIKIFEVTFENRNFLPNEILKLL